MTITTTHVACITVAVLAGGMAAIVYRDYVKEDRGGLRR